MKRDEHAALPHRRVYPLNIHVPANVPAKHRVLNHGGSRVNSKQDDEKCGALEQGQVGVEEAAKQDAE